MRQLGHFVHSFHPRNGCWMYSQCNGKVFIFALDSGHHFSKFPSNHGYCHIVYLYCGIYPFCCLYCNTRCELFCINILTFLTLYVKLKTLASKNTPHREWEGTRLGTVVDVSHKNFKTRISAEFADLDTDTGISEPSKLEILHEYIRNFVRV